MVKHLTLRIKLCVSRSSKHNVPLETCQAACVFTRPCNFITYTNTNTGKSRCQLFETCPLANQGIVEPAAKVSSWRYQATGGDTTVVSTASPEAVTTPASQATMLPVDDNEKAGRICKATCAMLKRKCTTGLVVCGSSTANVAELCPVTCSGEPPQTDTTLTTSPPINYTDFFKHVVPSKTHTPNGFAQGTGLDYVLEISPVSLRDAPCAMQI